MWRTFTDCISSSVVLKAGQQHLGCIQSDAAKWELNPTTLLGQRRVVINRLCGTAQASEDGRRLAAHQCQQWPTNLERLQPKHC
jgi:hypothetical protein